MIDFCGKTVLRWSDESMMDQCLSTIPLALGRSHFGSHLQFQIRTGALKRPPCSNFALLNDHFSISLVFNVNLNSKLRNIFMIFFLFTCRNVEILIFFLVPVNSEEGESRKRSVNIVLHC